MKKESTKKQSVVSMPLVHPNAAGIDIGDTFHAVAVEAETKSVSNHLEL